MNKLYAAGAVLVGFGMLLSYHAGRQDMQAELKKAEAKKWREAMNESSLPDPEQPE